MSPRLSNYTFVCFDCRRVVRRDGWSDVRCPHCAQACECLGRKTPVPPSSKLKAWQKLRADFYAQRRESLLRRQKGRVRMAHELEVEIARLEALPENPQKSAALTYLKRRLDSLRRRQ